MKFWRTTKRKDYCPSIAVKYAFVACSQEHDLRVAAHIEVIWRLQERCVIFGMTRAQGDTEWHGPQSNI